MDSRSDARQVRVVHWTCQQPTPYNDYLFAAIAAIPGIDLTVHYIDEKLASHPWTTPLAQGYKSRVCDRHFGVDTHLLKTLWVRRGDFYVFGSWQELTAILMLSWMAFTGKPFAVWTDAPNLKKSRAAPKAYLRGKWLNWIFRKASYVMGTGALALHNLAQMGCPQDKLVNFPYIINIDAFVPSTAFRRNHSHLVFASSGRLVNSHKGYDQALRALAVIKQKTGRIDFSYRIAGTGPDMESLKALTAQLGLEKNVDFVGWLEPAQLPEFYGSADIFLHPALFEPYGVTVIEALAAGLIVIGSDQTGAVVDRIVDGSSGFIHRANDVGDLAAKIECAINCLPSKGEMVGKGRAAAQCWPVERAVGVIESMVGCAKQRDVAAGVRKKP